ncbi:MAG TPA: UDP-2,3-diacylglucosamine diphosphatase [Rhodocyclaceae bacterium]|nr:UDP-2,3-diacylglucosamine diphosphatase [Rhodocyclaceae bacterium]
MILFCSDLHLDPARLTSRVLFADFLAGPVRRAGALYILGDLFEYWAGDDDDDPFNASVCADLKACADSGVPLFFLPGNRDFLVGPGFERASGVRVIDEPTIVGIGSRRVVLLHGDTLCTDDADYQEFRARVRTPGWRDAFLGQPVAERRRAIAELRRRSESEKRSKPTVIMDVNRTAVVTALRDAEAVALIHGHTHRPGHHRFEVDGHPGERWVLPEWSDTGGYLCCAGDDWHFVALP